MRKRTADVLWRGLVAGVLALTIAGCGKEEPKRPAPPPSPRPQRAETPDYEVEEEVVSPAEELDLDARVQFPDQQAPESKDLARAVADLANGLARGDSALVRSVLASDGQRVLRGLEDAGAWERATGSIEAVRVCILRDLGDTCDLGLGIQDDSGAYLLGWSGAIGPDGWRFAALAIEDQNAGNVRELDDAPLTPMDLGTASGANDDPDDDPDEDATD